MFWDTRLHHIAVHHILEGTFANTHSQHQPSLQLTLDEGRSNFSLLLLGSLNILSKDSCKSERRPMHPGTWHYSLTSPAPYTNPTLPSPHKVLHTSRNSFSEHTILHQPHSPNLSTDLHWPRIWPTHRIPLCNDPLPLNSHLHSPNLPTNLPESLICPPHRVLLCNDPPSLNPLPSNDAAPSPHEGNPTVIQIPAEDLSCLSQQHESLSIGDNLRCIQSLVKRKIRQDEIKMIPLYQRC